jgi:hypothetical protein
MTILHCVPCASGHPGTLVKALTEAVRRSTCLTSLSVGFSGPGGGSVAPALLSALVLSRDQARRQDNDMTSGDKTWPWSLTKLNCRCARLVLFGRCASVCTHMQQ